MEIIYQVLSVSGFILLLLGVALLAAKLIAFSKKIARMVDDSDR